MRQPEATRHSVPFSPRSKVSASLIPQIIAESVGGYLSFAVLSNESEWRPTWTRARARCSTTRSRSSRAAAAPPSEDSDDALGREAAANGFGRSAGGLDFALEAAVGERVECRMSSDSAACRRDLARSSCWSRRDGGAWGWTESAVAALRSSFRVDMRVDPGGWIAKTTFVPGVPMINPRTYRKSFPDTEERKIIKYIS